MVSYLQIKEAVRDEVGKGYSIESLIAGKIFDAVRFLENNNSFFYMQKFIEGNLSPDSATPRTIALPAECKSFKFIRFVLEDNGQDIYHYPNNIDPKDLQRVGSGLPQRFWLDGNAYIWFDNTPDVDYLYEMQFNMFTDTLSMRDTDTCWLFNNGKQAIVAKTMQLLGPSLRENFTVLYQDSFNEGLRSLQLAQEEMEFSSSPDIRMEYQG